MERLGPGYGGSYPDISRLRWDLCPVSRTGPVAAPNLLLPGANAFKGLGTFPFRGAAESSCLRFVANQVRLWLFVLAYNLGNFLGRLVLPSAVKHWSLRSLQVKLIKIGARRVGHARRIIFQMAEVAVPKDVFEAVLRRIGRLNCANT